MAIDAKAKEMRRSGRDVVSFSVGERISSPQYIRTAAHEALDMGLTSLRRRPARSACAAQSAKAALDNGLEYCPRR